MPIFKYEAMDAAGKKVIGELGADSRAGLTKALRDKGLFPTKIDEVAFELIKQEKTKPNHSSVYDDEVDERKRVRVRALAIFVFLFIGYVTFMIFMSAYEDKIVKSGQSRTKPIEKPDDRPKDPLIRAPMNLATIHNNYPVNQDHPDVEYFKAIITSLCIKTTQQDPMRCADILLVGHRDLVKYGVKDEDLKQFALNVERSIPPKATGVLSLAEVSAAYVTLRSEMKGR